MFKIVRITGSGPINGLINGSKNAYKKYSLITGDKEFALIKWYPHVKTDVHSHKGKRCSFFLLTFTLFVVFISNSLFITEGLAFCLD